MILDEARETTDRGTLYKRTRSIAYGKVDLSEVAYLLRRERVQPQAAKWYQRYLQQVRLIRITVAGVSWAWRFKIGVFRVYLCSDEMYREAVGPEDTGFLSFLTNTGNLRAAPKR